MSVIDARIRPQFTVYPGGYRRVDCRTVAFDRYLPQLPTPSGVPLMNRPHCEIVRHEQYTALLTIRDGDEERLLAMRRVAAWGDVLNLCCFGDDHLYVRLHPNADRPDHDILTDKWPFGPVTVL